MTSPAQTNIQLFNQLADEAYCEAEIERVRDAYVLAMQLFSGLYRASGKTFIAHAVGTASVIAGAGAPVSLVTAALLHAAYPLGDFGTFRRKITSGKRARVEAAIGSEAEELVNAYAAFRWDEAALQTALSRDWTSASPQRNVLLMRLANEVDEYADLGALHSPGWERRVASARSFLPQCVELAMRLHNRKLAEVLDSVAAQTLAYDRALSVTVNSDQSVLIAPLSLTPRPYVRVRAFARRIFYGFSSISSDRASAALRRTRQ